MRRLVLLLLSFIPLQSFAQTLEDDRLALVAIYHATQKSLVPTVDVKAWKVPGSPGDNPCGWEGVECATVGNQTRVIYLTLDEAGGYLPAEIGKMDALVYLNINGGEGSMIPHAPLSGAFPSEISNLQSLNDIVVNNCIFTSDGLRPLFDVPNLKNLSVTITSPIPDLFNKLPNLETLGLVGYNGTAVKSENNGSIPPSITTLSKLQSLLIGDAGFSGPIPQQIENLSNLSYLNVTGLTNAGPIPAAIGKLKKLQLLNLQNGHTGQIPAEINKLVNLVSANLNNNALTGSIPDLSALRDGIMTLNNNRFNFDQLEPQARKLREFFGQPILKLNRNKRVLSVYAGGTLIRNIYQWYKNGKLEATIIGDSTYTVTSDATYRVIVKNIIASQSPLVSETLNMSLPVTLVSFAGLSEPESNLLTWQTASETNNAGFEIQRSADARIFEKFGYVDGNGDSKETNNYRYTDTNPFATTYYRLKQLDHDGKFEYSSIVSVKNASREVSVYPNPATDKIIVRGLNNPTQVKIFNQTGALQGKWTISGSQPIDVSSLKNGLFVVEIGSEIHKVLINN